ncbi:MAG: LysR family transcriptional regulator [Ramlibacter sp.]
MFDWNDLKYFLAVAREGSMIAAARTLRVDQSTVQRRLKELESRLGAELVTRRPNGYALTAFGVQLLPLAQGVEAAVLALDRAVGEQIREGRGVIRITCPEPILARLNPFVGRFQARHQNLQVEFVASDRYVDVVAGEADIAFRSGDTDAALTGVKIADSIWSVYASPDYIARHGRPASMAELSQHPIVAFDDSMPKHRIVPWLNEVAPNATIASRSNSVFGLASAIRSGVGLGPLPHAVAADVGGLVEVLGPIPALTRSLRMLTTPALRHTAPIAAFFNFIADEKAAVRKAFS